jgi:hypothetical protein
MPLLGKAALKTARAHLVKLPEREITPYVWVHPDDDDRR